MRVELTSAELPRLPHNQKVVVVWGTDPNAAKQDDCTRCVCGPDPHEDPCRRDCLDAEDIVAEKHKSPPPNVVSWVGRLRA